jgi:hypothetical protein
MAHPVQPAGSDTTTDIDLTARPNQITAGGIVLLEATLPEGEGTYRVVWKVTGPVRLSAKDTRIALLGTTSVADDRVTLDEDHNILLRATLDTSPLAVGTWQVSIRLTPIEDDDDHDRDDDDRGRGGGGGRPVLTADPASVDVLARPFASGDDVSVTMKRTAVPATTDQALWVAIRNSTNAIGFENYSRFIDLVMCGELRDAAGGLGLDGADDRLLRRVNRRTTLPFPNVNRYRLLKAATEVFLMINCGVDQDVFEGLDLAAESRRLNRTVTQEDIEQQFRDYLVRVDTNRGDFIDVLPYLGLIRLQLRDVAIVGLDDEVDSAEACFGILAEKLARPCFLELIWAYWTDEGGPMQAMKAISWRFQNRSAGPPGRDPLASMDVDPLRPLNNLIWGWIQDEQHRLTMARRAYEYDHAYGMELQTRQGPPVRGADSRSRFVEAFHHLLALSSIFYAQDDNTTVIADGFPVLNALKETHLLLTQGAHNQYGDLPWTARHEMLMGEWILARPELKDFLATRTMVAYPEPWMDRVEAMNKLQNWSETSVVHFRDLAVFGEQLLLGIRFGAWAAVIEPEQAANWARYWRAEVQGYLHAYRAVTGTDLTHRTDSSILTATHLRRRNGAYRN